MKEKISIKPKPTSQSNQGKLRNESIDFLIDLFQEGKETVLSFNEESLSLAQLPQWQYETRNLLAIELVKFDSNPCKLPDFTQNFKSRVHNKKCFKNPIRRESLINKCARW